MIDLLVKNTHMKRFFIAMTVVLSMVGCAKNKITGRIQLQLYNEADIQKMAAQEYRQFLSQNRVVSATASKDAEMVRRVGQRIAAAVTQYYKKQGLSAELEG